MKEIMLLVIGSIIGGVVSWFIQMRLSKRELSIRLRLETMKKVIEIIDRMYFNIRDIYNFSNRCITLFSNMIMDNKYDSDVFHSKYQQVYDALDKLHRDVSELLYILNNENIMFKDLFTEWIEKNKMRDYEDTLHKYLKQLIEIDRLYRINKRENIECIYKQAYEIVFGELSRIENELLQYNSDFKSRLQQFVLGDVFK